MGDWRGLAGGSARLDLFPGSADSENQARDYTVFGQRTAAVTDVAARTGMRVEQSPRPSRAAGEGEAGATTQFLLKKEFPTTWALRFSLEIFARGREKAFWPLWTTVVVPPLSSSSASAEGGEDPPLSGGDAIAGRSPMRKSTADNNRALREGRLVPFLGQSTSLVFQKLTEMPTPP